jgi:hypothetical protein
MRLARTLFTTTQVTSKADVKDGLPIQPPLDQPEWKFSKGLNYIMGGSEIPVMLALITMLELGNQTTSPTFTISDLVRCFLAQESAFEPNDPKSKENEAINTFLSTEPYKKIYESLKADPDFQREIAAKNIHHRPGSYETNPHQRLVALTIYNVVDLLEHRKREIYPKKLCAKTLHKWELRTSLDQGDTHNVALIARFTQTNNQQVKITSYILDPISQHHQKKHRKNQGPDYCITIPRILKYALSAYGITGITKASFTHQVVYLGNQFGGYCTSHAQRLAEEAKITINQNQEVTLTVPQEGMMRNGAYDRNYKFNTSVVCEEIAWSIQRLATVYAELNNPNNRVHRFVYRILQGNHPKNHPRPFKSLKALLITLDKIKWNMQTDYQRAFRQRLTYVHYREIADQTSKPLKMGDLEASNAQKQNLIANVQEHHINWPLPEWMQEKLQVLGLQDKHWKRLATEFLEVLVQEYDQETSMPDIQEQMQHAERLAKTDTCCVIS